MGTGGPLCPLCIVSSALVVLASRATSNKDSIRLDRSRGEGVDILFRKSPLYGIHDVNGKLRRCETVVNWVYSAFILPRARGAARKRLWSLTNDACLDHNVPFTSLRFFDQCAKESHPHSRPRHTSTLARSCPRAQSPLFLEIQLSYPPRWAQSDTFPCSVSASQQGDMRFAKARLDRK